MYEKGRKKVSPEIPIPNPGALALPPLNGTISLFVGKKWSIGAVPGGDSGRPGIPYLLPFFGILAGRALFRFFCLLDRNSGFLERNLALSGAVWGSLGAGFWEAGRRLLGGWERLLGGWEGTFSGSEADPGSGTRGGSRERNPDVLSVRRKYANLNAY